MPKYQLDIPHTLAADEAKKRITDATGKLSSDYGASCTWKSDNELAVSRKGLDARVMLEPSRVRIDLNLGFLMTPFADMIKTGITKKLTAILTAVRLIRSSSRGDRYCRRLAFVQRAAHRRHARPRLTRPPLPVGAPGRAPSRSSRTSDRTAAAEMLKFVQRMRFSR